MAKKAGNPQAIRERINGEYYRLLAAAPGEARKWVYGILQQCPPPNGVPEEVGVYVAYCDADWAGYAERKLLLWCDGRWWCPRGDRHYRGHVYGWIGPIPAMPLPKSDQ